MEYIGGGKWESMDNIHSPSGFKGAGVLGSRPVAEKKAIKTVAKVAAVAAAVYYGGAALKAAAGAASAAGGGTTIASAISAASKYASVGGLVLQGAGMVQQARAADRMQAAEEDRQAAAERVQESQERQSQVEAQRARMAAVREQRILQGRLIASAGQGGMGLTGTSAIAGSTAGLNTQLGTAIGNINVAQGFAAEQSAANVDYGRATSDVFTASNQGSAWSNLASLGKELRGGQSVGQTLGTIFSAA